MQAKTPNTKTNSKLTKPRLLKTVILLCFLAVVSSCFVACTSSLSQQIVKDPDPETFVVGFDQSFAPFGSIDENGTAIGFDLELAEEVAKRNNWNIHFKPISWETKKVELSRGLVDCVWNGFTTENREDEFTFTDHYLSDQQIFVVRRGSGIRTADDLSNKIVIAQSGSSAQHLLIVRGQHKDIADTFKELRIVYDYDEAFESLEYDRVDAIAMDKIAAQNRVHESNGYFTLIEEPLATDHYAIGFQLGNTELRDTVQSTLIEMYKDGFVEELCNKYVDQGIDYELWSLRG